MSETSTTITIDTVVINGRTYQKRMLRHLVEGDVVLASYDGGCGTLWNTPGGFAFNHDAETLSFPDERQYWRIQRWEVEDRSRYGFSLKRAKSGTRPKWHGVSIRTARESGRPVWVEVK